MLRDGIATFASQFVNGFPIDCENQADFLRSLKLTNCAYGAAECRVYPLLIELTGENRFRTGRDALRLVKARTFQSEHIESLDAEEIPFPGYHPGTKNDEVHSDAMAQNIFSHGEDADETTVVHRVLRNHVADGRLWYVLLHTTPKPFDEFMFSEYVILFAIGKAIGQDYVVGVVTHQVCHNLCD